MARVVQLGRLITAPGVLRGEVKMHKSGHLRDAFIELVERGEATDEQLQRVSGQLWNCTDVLPSGTATELDLTPGTTYAISSR
jgi:hypothetical protein